VQVPFYPVFVLALYLHYTSIVLTIEVGIK